MVAHDRALGAKRLIVNNSSLRPVCRYNRITKNTYNATNSVVSSRAQKQTQRLDAGQAQVTPKVRPKTAQKCLLFPITLHTSRFISGEAMTAYLVRRVVQVRNLFRRAGWNQLVLLGLATLELGLGRRRRVIAGRAP